MWILELKTINHPVLGDQTINFRTKLGTPLNTIIFAGENGCGKSSVMNLIYEICSLKIPNLTKNESRELTILMNVSEFNGIRYAGDIPELLDWKERTPFTIGFDSKQGKDKTSFFIEYNTNSKASKKLNLQKFLYSEHAKRMLGCIFLDHDLHRQTKDNRQKKEGHWQGRRSSESGGYNSSYELYNSFTSHIQSYRNSIRMRRFESSLNANSRIESTKKYTVELKKTQEKPGQIKKILEKYPYTPNEAILPFKTNIKIIGTNSKMKYPKITKDKRIFGYDSLSSGEKQILGMSGFLTRNIGGADTGALILIDEPENNLHPNWQLLFKKFLSSLFKNRHQIFIVTHSPFLIHENKNLLTEKVFIFKRSAGTINISDNALFYGIGDKSPINDAFDINLLIDDASLQPLVLLEGETDESYLKDAKNLFFDDLNIDFKWIGNYEKEKAIFTGSSALDKAFEFLKNRPEVTRRKIALTYDCDQSKIELFNNRHLYVNKLPLQRDKIYKKGIENILSLPSTFEYKKFYKSSARTDDYGAPTTSSTLDKKKLCEHILSLPPRQRKKIYSALKCFLDDLIKSLA